jgi:hypothetical protein
MDEPFSLYLPRNRRSGDMKKEWVCIVEDIISCEKINKLTPAVALMGTHMNDRQAHVIASHYPNGIIMLDPDALVKSATIHSKYKGVFSHFRIVSLTDDPKDTPLETIEKVLRSVKGSSY